MCDGTLENKNEQELRKAATNRTGKEAKLYHSSFDEATTIRCIEKHRARRNERIIVAGSMRV
jgi:hypothetical protein